MTSPALAAREAQHRQVLAAMRPGRMADALRRVFPPENGRLTCRVLDVKYIPGEYCRVLYQLGGEWVVGSLRWGAEDVQMPAAWIDPPGMWAYPFPNDPALPGLPAALDPTALGRALAKALPGCRANEVRLLRSRVVPLRYRPGKRCTLRLELGLRGEDGTLVLQRLYGKVYHDAAKAAAVFDEMRMLSQSPALAGRVMLARPVAMLPGLNMVVQEAIEGTTLDRLLGRAHEEGPRDERAIDGVTRAAAAMAALHAAGLRTGRERPVEAELERFAVRAAQVKSVNPSLGAQLGALAAALPRWLNRLPEWGAHTALVHGDCKPSQFMIGPQGVALIDFDHVGMADPASDVGTFLATLRQLERERSPEVSNGTATGRGKLMGEEVLRAYAATPEHGPGLRSRATWYAAVALMRKALRAFSRSPSSPLPAALVEEGWSCLAGLT